MRTLRCTWSAAAVILGATAVLFFLGCEGDEGPVGPPGDPGTTSCLTCHTDDNTDIIARSNQWENSRHATGGTYERNTSSCAGCHTSEGFVAQLETGTAGSPENPSPIGCFTCHAPHTEGDFSLRIDDPVTFGYGGGVFDYGPANLCANCHQARSLNPPIAADPDSTTITDKRWGPHHGPQSNMLAGTAGYEFSTGSYMDSYHTTGVTNGCVDCHMAAPVGAQAGGHQFGLEYGEEGDEEYLVSGCNVSGCHSSDPLEDFNRLAFADYDGDLEIEGVQDEIDGLMSTLRTALLARGFLDAEDYVLASSTSPLKLSEAEAGAVYNFRYVLEDKSRGIHNTDYTVELLQSAIDNLP